MKSDFDAIILGAGSGGLTAAVGLALFGKKVALIERDWIGGDCTNLGCIPSKTLIHLSGSCSEEPAKALLAQVRARRDRLREEETAWVESLEGLTLVRATARFTGSHAVEARYTSGHEQILTARVIVIATGSSPRTIFIEGLGEERKLTNKNLFELDDVPEHLAIVGGGAIGSEMAFAFRRLGSRVTLVQRSQRLLSGLEPEVGELIRAQMEREGIKVIVSAVAERYQEASQTLTVRQYGDEIPIEGVERVLLALGRRPNIQLDLENAGITSTAAGIVTTSVGRTNVRHIYAIGDVTTSTGSTHAAHALGRRAVRSIVLPWLPAGPSAAIPAAVFTDPEVAHVGPSLWELQQQFAPQLIRSLRVDLADTDRGYTSRTEAGFVLLHALRFSGRVLSATIVAPAAGEMIPLLTLAVQRRIPLWALSDLVFPYPVLSEAIKKAADSFVLETLPHLPRELAAYLNLRWRRPQPRGKGRRRQVAAEQTGSPAAASVEG